MEAAEPEISEYQQLLHDAFDILPETCGGCPIRHSCGIRGEDCPIMLVNDLILDEKWEEFDGSC